MSFASSKGLPALSQVIDACGFAVTGHMIVARPFRVPSTSDEMFSLWILGTAKIDQKIFLNITQDFQVNILIDSSGF